MQEQQLPQLFAQRKQPGIARKHPSCGDSLKSADTLNITGEELSSEKDAKRQDQASWARLMSVEIFQNVEVAMLERMAFALPSCALGIEQEVLNLWKLLKSLKGQIPVPSLHVFGDDSRDRQVSADASLALRNSFEKLRQLP